MEGISVNLDALLLDREATPIGEMGLRCYRFPDVPEGTYRLFFADGSYQDVQAENASHACQMAEKKSVTRIISLKFMHHDILERGVIHPSGEEVSPRMASPEEAALFSTAVERVQGVFEMLDLAAFAALTQNVVPTETE
jgi:hypothetical protein